MLKKLKRYGNTFVINFTSEEIELYNLKEGDIIDLGDMLIKKTKNKKEQKMEAEHIILKGEAVEGFERVEEIKEIILLGKKGGIRRIIIKDKK